MSLELGAQDISQAAKEGFERMKSYRMARAMFIKDYVGHYFHKPEGMTGDYPINLIFLAIRALIPNLVMKEGVNKILTPIIAEREKAELLGLALDKSQKQRKLKNILRAALCDMCFGFAILETSLDASGVSLAVNDINVDPGQIYTDLISLDDFTFDATCTSFEKAVFKGHNIRVPRQTLLDKNWNEELVLQLPSADDLLNNDKASDLTIRNQNTKTNKLQDYVNVVKIWVPEAEAICYIPNPHQTSFDDFLNIQDYYGPAEGPYTIGSLTPPVPDNPLPVAPVGIWRDLNEIANRIFTKFMDQADRQKDIMFYRPGYEDVADAAGDAVDGESIATDDPNAVQVVSFGGQNDKTERMVGELRSWFNYMAGNPDQMAGQGSSARTGKATEVKIMQANASVVTEDMRDIIADVASGVSSKEAWFINTDPLINSPLTRRTTGDKEVQIWLTPEQKLNDWAELTFTIVKRSMTIMEPALRSRLIMEFYTNVVPSVMTSAQIALQAGIEFNVPRALMQAAEELGISEILMEVFDDPTFTQRMAQFANAGPQDPGKGQLNIKGVMQNGGSSITKTIATPEQQFNIESQEGSADAQAAWRSM
jgi:hypothetical protein